MKYLVFDNDRVGDESLIDEFDDRKLAMAQARATVEQRRSSNVMVCPVIRGVPGQPIYRVCFAPGIGIEEPIRPGRGAPPGNTNAEEPGEHESIVVRIKKPDVDLLYDFFMQQGNPEPSRRELQDAVLFAVQQVYGRRLEDQQAMIS